MTACRRTTVFIDGSAFRDTLRKAYFDRFRRLEETIDYHAFGQFLCAADEQLVRVNYYTGQPVDITEAQDEATGQPKPMMGRIELGDHEAHRAQRVLDGHRRLVRHVDDCRYTRLATGRVVAHRRSHLYGTAFAWAQKVLIGVGDLEMSSDDKLLFDEAVRANQDAREYRRRLAARLDEIRDQRNVPSDLLPRYTEYVSMLRDEAISFQEKGVDTLLTVEMMEGCLRDTFDVAILFAADEDYVPLVEAVKHDGRRVVHAFLDVPNFGRRLRLACDDCRVVTEADLHRLVNIGA
jgi:uncharacterized LabA/DUF88 family protein